MRKIVFGFCALTVATWLLNLGFNPPAMNGRGLTHEVFFLNGVLAWGLMAMAIVIAARPAWLEKVTATPLDELYKWHRTLGIWAAVLTLFHFFTKELMRPVLSLVTLESVPKIVRGELPVLMRSGPGCADLPSNLPNGRRCLAWFSLSCRLFRSCGITSG